MPLERGLGQLVRRLGQTFGKERPRLGDAAGSGRPCGALRRLQLGAEDFDDERDGIFSGKLVGRKALLIPANHPETFGVLERGRQHEHAIGTVRGETNREVGSDPPLRLGGPTYQALAQL